MAVTSVRTLRENSGLFLELASVDLSPDGVKQFADKHGALGRLQTQVSLSKTNVHRQFYRGERLSAWYAEIDLLRRMLPLWDERYKRRSKPTTQFTITPAGILAEWDTQAERGFEIIASPSTSPELYEQLKGKPIEIARHYLRTKINSKLLEHPSTPQLLYDQSRGGLALYFVPTSLIAAMWLQFASAVDGDRQYRTCKTCGKWFEIGGSTGRRRDAETCSDSCRAAYPRKRHFTRQKRKLRVSTRRVL
jgi:hypothetical protein